MLGSKNGQRNREEQSAKRHDLVRAMLLRQFSDNFDEADNEKQRRTNIHPECDRRHAKRRESQSRYDDNELLELQRWTLPPVNSSGDILELPTKRGNQTVTCAKNSRSRCRLQISIRAEFSLSGCEDARQIEPFDRRISLSVTYEAVGSIFPQ